MNDRMIDKIKKLLALAESDNENEAKLAMERASELLLRHNLSMADVTISRPEIKEETVKEGFKSIPVEDKFILTIIKKYFFVELYYSKTRFCGVTSNTLQFIGEPMNIEVASFTYAYLFASYRHLWLKYKRSCGATERSRQAFYAGLTQGIKEQLETNKQNVQVETGLVVVTDPRIRDYMNKLSLTYTKQKPIRGDRDAAAAGALAGRDLEIRRGLKSSQSAKASGLYLK